MKKLISTLGIVGLFAPALAFAAVPEVTINPVDDLCGAQEVELTGTVTFFDPTSQDSFVIEVDGEVVIDNDDEDDNGPDGVPHNWVYTVFLGLGTHTVTAIDYDNPVTNTVVRASDSTTISVIEGNAIDTEGNCIRSSGGGIGISVLPYEDDPLCAYAREHGGMCLVRPEGWQDEIRNVVKQVIYYSDAFVKNAIMYI